MRTMLLLIALICLLAATGCAGMYKPPPHTLPPPGAYAGLQFEDCKDNISIHQIPAMKSDILESLMKSRGYVPYGMLELQKEHLPSSLFLEKDAEQLNACAALYSVNRITRGKRLATSSTTIKRGDYFSPPNNGRIISRETNKKGNRVSIKYEYEEEFTTYDLTITYWKKIAGFDPARNAEHRLSRHQEKQLKAEVARLNKELGRLKASQAKGTQQEKEDVWKEIQIIKETIEMLKKRSEKEKGPGTITQ